jgi:hypothetical protein
MLGGAVDAPRFAQHSQRFRANEEKTKYLNKMLSTLVDSEGKSKRGFSSERIPGTFKSVQTLKNIYAPSGRDDNNVIYHTSTGGHYNNEGNFITGYGQQARYGSMTDAIDTITAASESGKTDTIPSKFDQAWYDKQMNIHSNLTKTQRIELKKSWDKVKDIKKATTRDMTKDQHVRVKSEPKQKVTKGKKDQITKQSTGQGRDIIKTKTIPSRRISSPKSSPTYSPGHPSQR